MTKECLIPGAHPNPDVQKWEEMYRRFETPEQEVQKFLKRLKKFQVQSWPKDLEILELFSGRGNGLKAWEILGFTHLQGLDLSPDLVAQYQGIAKCHVGDACDLPFEDNSFDVICIQGGLHHLPNESDFNRSLAEVARVLRPQGRLLIVEPYMTPFLQFVQTAYSIKLIRKAWSKLDALATMVELEGNTYKNWLASGPRIIAAFQKTTDTQWLSTQWGKIMFKGVSKKKS